MKITAQIKGLEKFSCLNKASIFKAQKRTTTEIGRKFRTKVVKNIRNTYNIKAKDLKKSMRTKIERKSDAFIWSLNVKSRLLSLTYFGARQTKKGVSVLIKKNSGRKILTKTFIAKEQVFQRETKKRLPIAAKKTLSIPQMFNKQTMQEAFKEASKEYPKRFEHNLNYYLNKIK